MLRAGAEPAADVETVRSSLSDRSVVHLVRINRVLLLGAAAGYLLLYLVLALLRIGYPFELEWMEGGILLHVRRVLSGDPIYAAPSLEFIAFPYTPLYYYVAAAVAQLLGTSTFVPLRSVSVAASLGCFAIIFAIVRRETGNRFAAALATGLFAATYRLSGAWFDVARADTLFVFLALAAIYLLRSPASRASLAMTGLLLALAFLAKQTASVIALPLLVYSCWSVGKRALWLILPAAALFVASTWYLTWLSDGWYWYYIVELQRAVGQLVPRRLVWFWTEDLLRPMAVSVAFGAWYVIAGGNAERNARWFYAVAAGAMIAAAWASRIRTGNYDNVLMPAHAGLAILFGISLASAMSLAERLQLQAGARASLAILLHAFCLAQFAALSYDPRPHIVPERLRDAGGKLAALISHLDGDVLFPCHGYLAVRSGKRAYAHETAMFDILRHGRRADRDRLGEEIRKAIHEQRFAAIAPCMEWLMREFELTRWYAPSRPLVADGVGLVPITGARYLADTLYLPRHSQ